MINVYAVHVLMFKKYPLYNFCHLSRNGNVLNQVKINSTAFLVTSWILKYVDRASFQKLANFSNKNI